MRHIGLLTASVFAGAMLYGAARAAETDLYDFRGGNDAEEPIGRVVISGTALYGVTFHGGGSCNCGAIFKLDLQSGKESVAQSLDSKPCCVATGLIESHGVLYGGTTGGTVYAFNTKTGVYSTLTSFGDGGSVSGLLAAGTVLYVIEGGNGATKVYEVSTKNGHARVVATVAGYVDDNPILVSGLLVVPVSDGTDLPNGGIVTINPKTHAVNTLYAFAGGNDAAGPGTSLLAVNGVLYGTTYSGGVSGEGTIYSVDAATGAERVLHSFSDNPDGAYPFSSLIERNNDLWGTTVDGGAFGQGIPTGGTVLTYNIGTGVEDVAYSFQSGKYQFNSPEAGLVFYKNAFYGTTTLGGGYSAGSIFKVLAK